MPYRRSQEIEKRLQQLLALIRAGRHSTRSLARALKTSEPTVARSFQALRERGYSIRSVRNGNGWHYEMVAEPAKVPAG